MAMLSQPAFGPRTSLIYITVGALMDVWTSVYYFMYARGNPDVHQSTWFWLVGLFLTGLTLIIIGVLLGPIGQSARRAELPPPEAAAAEASIQQTAAATPHPMMQQPVMAGVTGGVPVAPGMVPGMPMPAAPMAPPVAQPGVVMPRQ